MVSVEVCDLLIPARKLPGLALLASIITFLPLSAQQDTGVSRPRIHPSKAPPEYLAQTNQPSGGEGGSRPRLGSRPSGSNTGQGVSRPRLNPPTRTAGTPKTIPIVLTQPWTSTGIQVTEGQSLTITAQGTLDWCHGGCPNANRNGPATLSTPDGFSCDQRAYGGGFLASQLPCDSLIGKIGNGEPFKVGASAAITAQKSGELFLGVNDNNYRDNAPGPADKAGWTAVISLSATPAAPNDASSDEDKVLFTDDFAGDAGLNAALWSTGTPLLKNLAQTLASSLTEPRLSFSASGMSMSGITAGRQFTGLQANKLFTPPFRAGATVTVTASNGRPFAIGLISKDGSSRILVSANLSPANPGARRNSVITVSGKSDSTLYPSVALNVPYRISLSVSGRTALVVVRSRDGETLASQDEIEIGNGPFYLVLGQYAGIPYTAAPVNAVWKQAQVTAFCIYGLMSGGCGAASDVPVITTGEPPDETPSQLPAAPDRDLYRTLSTQDPPKVRNTSALDAWIKGAAFGAESRFEDALFWYERSAAKGNADAAFEIGLLYDWGWGVTQDRVKAARWYEVARSKGQPIAMRRLGVLYYGGTGVEKNPGRTLQLGREAVAAGESDAAFGLAQLDPAQAARAQQGKRLKDAAIPVCMAARNTMAGLLTQMYDTPGFRAAGGIANLQELLDGGFHPRSGAPDRTIENVSVTKVHGPREIECDAAYLPEGNVWPFRINRIDFKGPLVASPFSADFVTKDGTRYLVTRASFPQYLLLGALRQQFAAQGQAFVPGLHDLGP